MSDIFISYASEDRELAKMLAHALGNQGWSVWWDRKIPFGKTYDEIIAENLATAHCVIVLWTHHSVKSRWVRAEASEAAERNVLIPILMSTEIKIPLQFKLLQAANLTGWKPNDGAHSEFERLLAHINELLAAPQPAVQPVPNQPNNPTVISATVAPDSGAKSKPRKKALLILGIIVSLSILAGSVTYAMMNWRVPTRIQVDLVVDRVELMLDGIASIPRIDFQSATIERFSKLSFSPKQLEVMATTASMSERDRAEFMVNLQDGGQVILRGEKNRFSAVTIDSLAEENKQTGSLESIRVKPGATVIFDASHSSSHSFTLQLAKTGLEFTPAIKPVSPFKLTASNALSKDKILFNPRINPIVLQVELNEDNPFVTLGSEPDTFIVTVTPASSVSAKSLLKDGSPVSKIEFLKQGEDGEFESTLIQTGKIAYADFADINPITVDQHHFLALDGLSNATIQEFRYDPRQNGFVLRLAGEAGKIVSRSGELTKDHRLTVFDKLWHNQRLSIIFSMVLWIGSVILGVYKIYQEVKKHA